MHSSDEVRMEAMLRKCDAEMRYTGGECNQ